MQSSRALHGVRRRYSDFEWIRDLLVFRYHGCFVPMLPSKTMTGKGEAAIKLRMEGLQYFLCECLKVPYFRIDQSFNTWLVVKEVAGFEALKKVRSWCGSMVDTSGGGNVTVVVVVLLLMLTVTLARGTQGCGDEMDGKGTCAASNPGFEHWHAALAHWSHPDDADAVSACVCVRSCVAAHMKRA